MDLLAIRDRKPAIIHQLMMFWTIHRLICLHALVSVNYVVKLKQSNLFILADKIYKAWWLINLTACRLKKIG